jgi:hypothetical protein
LPGKVFATEYDLGQNGFAYLDKDIAIMTGQSSPNGTKVE